MTAGYSLPSRSRCARSLTPCTRRAARSLSGVRVLAEAATLRVCVSAVLSGHVIDCSHVQYMCICFGLRAEVLSWLSVAQALQLTWVMQYMVRTQGSELRCWKHLEKAFLLAGPPHRSTYAGFSP